MLQSWITLAVLMLAQLTATGQGKPPNVPTRNWTTIWGWTTASWDGNDKPYQQIRLTIDKAIAGGRKPQDLMGLYGVQARKAPNDPQAQFWWAYAAYKAAKQSDYNTGKNILYEPRKSLVMAPFPHALEYARLIFLTDDYAVMFVPRLQQVSKRFLNTDPHDFVVKYAAAKNLIFNRDSADRQLAQKCMDELIQTQPQWAPPQGLQGFIYYQRWQESKSQNDAAKAIACYQRYLDLAPPNDSFRPRAQQTIAELQRG